MRRRVSLSTFHQQRREPSERICSQILSLCSRLCLDGMEKGANAPGTIPCRRGAARLLPCDGKTPGGDKLRHYVLSAAKPPSFLSSSPADPLAELASLLRWNERVGERRSIRASRSVTGSPAGRSRTCRMPRSALLYLQRLEHSERICSERICPRQVNPAFDAGFGVFRLVFAGSWVREVEGSGSGDEGAEQGVECVVVGEQRGALVIGRVQPPGFDEELFEESLSGRFPLLRLVSGVGEAPSLERCSGVDLEDSCRLSLSGR